MTSDLVPLADQISIVEFLELYNRNGVDFFASQIYQNRQRTSTRNGILKAKAVFHFSRVLADFGINYMQDTLRIVGVPDFERAIQQVPGQARGVSLRYFYMLVREENYVKPDRMIARFVEATTGQRMGIDQLHTVVVEACKILQRKYPYLTPAVLDNLIWRYQRTIVGQPSAT